MYRYVPVKIIWELPNINKATVVPILLRVIKKNYFENELWLKMDLNEGEKTDKANLPVYFQEDIIYL
jgi:hypothetical protein